MRTLHISLKLKGGGLELLGVTDDLNEAVSKEIAACNDGGIAYRINVEERRIYGAYLLPDQHDGYHFWGRSYPVNVHTIKDDEEEAEIEKDSVPSITRRPLTALYPVWASCYDSDIEVLALFTSHRRALHYADRVAPEHARKQQGVWVGDPIDVDPPLPKAEKRAALA